MPKDENTEFTAQFVDPYRPRASPHTGATRGAPTCHGFGLLRRRRHHAVGRLLIFFLFLDSFLLGSPDGRGVVFASAWLAGAHKYSKSARDWKAVTKHPRGNFTNVYSASVIQPKSAFASGLLKPFDTLPPRFLRNAAGYPLMSHKTMLTRASAVTNAEMGNTLNVPYRFYNQPQLSGYTLIMLGPDQVITELFKKKTFRPTTIGMAGRPRVTDRTGIAVLMRMSEHLYGNKTQRWEVLSDWARTLHPERKFLFLVNTRTGEPHSIHEEGLLWLDERNTMTLSEFTNNRFNEMHQVTMRYVEQIRSLYVRSTVLSTAIKEDMIHRVGDPSRWRNETEEVDRLVGDAAKWISMLMKDWYTDMALGRRIIGQVLGTLQSAYWAKDKWICMLSEEVVNLYGFRTLMPHDTRPQRQLTDSAVGGKDMWLMTTAPENAFRKRHPLVYHGLAAGPALLDVNRDKERLLSSLYHPAYTMFVHDLKIDIDSWRYHSSGTFLECPLGLRSDLHQFVALATGMWMDKLIVAHRLLLSSSSGFLRDIKNVRNDARRPWSVLIDFAELLPRFLTDLQVPAELKKALALDRDADKALLECVTKESKFLKEVVRNDKQASIVSRKSRYWEEAPVIEDECLKRVKLRVDDETLYRPSDVVHAFDAWFKQWDYLLDEMHEMIKDLGPDVCTSSSQSLEVWNF